MGQLLQSWLPGLSTLRHYRREWLLHDVVAGLALSAILVPVGMGYAQASGVDAIYGLYATMVPLVVYALFGPSRILVLGPDSTLAAVIAGVEESAVVGAPHPGFGEVRVAVVVPRAGATIDPDSILAQLKAQLAHFKVPKRCARGGGRVAAQCDGEGAEERVAGAVCVRGQWLI